MNEVHGESGEADGNIFRAVGAGGAVGNLFTFAGHNRLAGVHVDDCRLRAYSQQAA